MNYRHEFHAGNFADVFKHIILSRILLHLGAKPTPFRAIETHAGSGIYNLLGPEAGRPPNGAAELASSSRRPLRRKCSLSSSPIFKSLRR